MFASSGHVGCLVLRILHRPPHPHQKHHELLGKKHAPSTAVSDAPLVARRGPTAPASPPDVLPPSIVMEVHPGDTSFYLWMPSTRNGTIVDIDFVFWFGQV